jgi:hypothetical protein
MSGWTWAAADYRGTSHERSGHPLQDAHCCFLVGNSSEVFVSIVSDGAGSASFGGQGAALACRSLATTARAYFRDRTDLPCDDTIQKWVDAARDRIISVAIRRGVLPRQFASTLIFCISDAEHTVIAHIGDGCCVLQESATGQWIAPSWPEQGEYASMTRFLTDEPFIALRITRLTTPISAIVSFTDGLERLALDFVNTKPFDRFFDGISRPLAHSNASGRDSKLSGQLRQYLNSPQINARTDDDKTLIIATHQ